MRPFLTLANGSAVVFSAIWLVGHATVRVGDWEFWFAAGYLTLAAANFAYLARRRGALEGP